MAVRRSMIALLFTMAVNLVPTCRLSAQGGTATAAAKPVPFAGRVVGVYDLLTGDPIVGAKVADVQTGLSALTSTTGTVGLVYVDTTGGLIRITRFGYIAQTLFVENSPRDTVPVMILLTPNTYAAAAAASGSQALPAMVTTVKSRRSAADTVAKLEKNGFYERRETSGIATSVFVTEETLRKVYLFQDLPRLTGHGLCTTNLYIDGVLTDVAGSSGVLAGNRSLVKPPLRSGLDALLRPEDVVAMEMYGEGQVPARYNATRPSKCGATLIWTKQ